MIRKKGDKTERMCRTVSVIVPAYNAEKTIERCMDGLVNQSYQPTEIIVIDDGSSDNTGTILDQYAVRNENIRVIHQRNAGVSAARNRGLDEALSECILFVDSDDAIGERFVETLMKYSDYDYVTCGFHLQNPMLEWENIVFADEGQQMEAIRQHPSKYMGKYYFGSPWAKLYKREILEQKGLRFSTSIHNGEDTLFNFQYMFIAKTIRIVPLCDYFYFYQKSSLSHSLYDSSWEWRITQEKLIKNFFNGSKEKEINYLRQREFGVLKQLLRENCKNWTKQQIRVLYREPLFRQSIQYKRKKGSLDDLFLLFTLDCNIYKIYDFYLLIKKYARRGINHYKRKTARKRQN